jgi:hypothetical protein
VLLLIFCVLLGSPHLFAAPGPPACNTCGCKEIYAWRTKTRNGWQTTYSTGYKKDMGMGTWQQVQWGKQSPGTGWAVMSNSCPDLNVTQTDDTITYTQFTYAQPNPVCDGTPLESDWWIIEDSPSDINAGSQQTSTAVGRQKCIKQQ